MRGWMTGLVVASTVAGCGEPVGEYLEARRAAAGEKLARVARVAELTATLAPNDWATMKDPGPLAVCDLVIAPHRDKGCDTWVIGLEQLLSPRRHLAPEPLVRFGSDDWLVMTTSLLETGRFPPNERYPEGAEPDRLVRAITFAFTWLESVRYLIVVRTDELVPPVLAEDQKSYAPGSFRGEAMLFELYPEPRSLGGAPFSYAMVGDIQVRMQKGVIHKEQVDQAFAKGVREALSEALVGRLKQLERP